MNIRYLILLCSLIYFNNLPVFAETEEIYRFERMWPVLQQPWYFSEIWDIAVSQQGHVYVAEWNHDRVLKLTLDGHLITSFKRFDDELKPVQIAVDSNENLYVLYRESQSGDNSFLKKFSANGDPIEWESGNEPFFLGTQNIALDSNDNIYIPYTTTVNADDSINAVVKKFNSKGELTDEWPIESLTSAVWKYSEFLLSIAIDTTDHIYILYKGDNQIIKYTSGGKFIRRWGNSGKEAGQFNSPTDITTDSHNNLYVVDKDNHRVQKFTSEGQFLEQWYDESDMSEWQETIQSSPFLKILEIAKNLNLNMSLEVVDFFDRITDKAITGFSFLDSQFFRPDGIAVGPKNHVYVAYAPPRNSIQKYSANGDFITKWANSFHKQAPTNIIGDQFKDKFDTPTNLAIDKNGNIYITDMFNHRVVKFTANGRFMSEWGEPGSGEGQFIFPFDIAIDTNENIYILDLGNIRIQKLTAQGKFITQWGKLNLNINSKSDFLFPSGIVVDSHNHVYVVDALHPYPIKKFSSEGHFMTAFGDNAQMDTPVGISIDKNDNLYVADINNHHIKKFTTTGHLVETWGEKGQKNGQFEHPVDVATDDMGHVYVSDTYNHRIQKLTSDGQFVTKWGEFGTNPDQFSGMGGLTVSPDGDRVYVIGTVNNRIQVFNRTLYDPGKAIIVAGGGPYAGNDLWDDTQLVANFAYRALAYQGFTKNTIYYLSENTELDLDNNGETDDVDAKPSIESLKQAITEWASDADNLTLYLTDHGGKESFTLNQEETLSAKKLKDWLDIWQNQKNGRVKIIYDACNSGSFVDSLKNQNRIVITSAAADELAYFDDKGSLSFSNYFWTHVFHGIDVADSFRQASAAVNYLHHLQTEQTQTPWLEANGDGCVNNAADFQQAQKVFIGNGTFIHKNAPEVEAVSPEQTLIDTNSATIYAEVNTDNNIARVWAVVRSPIDIQRHIQPGTDKAVGQPIRQLPPFPLMWIENKNRYEGHYDDFTIAGRYEVAIYARDRDNNTSVPKTTSVFVKNPLERKAVILVGVLPEETQSNVKDAYEALKYQGYRDENIYYLGNTSIPGMGVVPRLPIFDNVEFALTTWAENNTQDIVIYLEGLGNQSEFRLNGNENLSLVQLKTWLDALQLIIPGAMTVIYEGAYSGYLLPALKQPPKDKTRIVISSTKTDDIDNYKSNGDTSTFSFSKFFWQKVYNGANTLDAFRDAKRPISQVLKQQTPQLDANGDGVDKKGDDYRIASKHSIGIGVVSANNETLESNISQTTAICLKPSQRKYLHGERVQVQLSSSPTPGEKAYFAVGLPTGELFSIEALNKFVPFKKIETLPIWTDTSQIAIDFDSNLPVGAYRLYSVTLPEETSLELPIEYQTLCESTFCVEYP